MLSRAWKTASSLRFSSGFTRHCSSLSPVAANEFARLVQESGFYSRPRSVCVAVSGGPDSLALALLMHHWCKQAKVHLHAVTVDHGFREESKDEANYVADLMSRFDIPHHIMTLPKAEPVSPSKLQKYAREHRYRLLQEFCVENQINHVFLGHNLNDQAETFLMRVCRASGLNGYACMQPATPVVTTPLVLMRPLLSVPKSRLIETCRQFEVVPVSDPSNQNLVFDRVRAREGLKSFLCDSLTIEDIDKTIKHSQARAMDFSNQAIQLLRRCATANLKYGTAVLTPSILVNASVPYDLKVRVLQRLMANVTGNETIRTSVLHQIMHYVQNDAPSKGIALSGAIFSRAKARRIRVVDGKFLAQGVTDKTLRLDVVPDVSNLDFDRRIQNAASLTLTGSVVFNNAFSLQASFDDPQANEKVLEDVNEMIAMQIKPAEFQHMRENIPALNSRKKKLPANMVTAVPFVFSRHKLLGSEHEESAPIRRRSIRKLLTEALVAVPHLEYYKHHGLKIVYNCTNLTDLRGAHKRNKHPNIRTELYRSKST